MPQFFPRTIKTLLILLLCACGLSEDRRFESERLRLVADINASLIDLQVCQSLPECQKRQLFFLSPREGGLSLQVWGIEDSGVLKKILDRSANLFFMATEIKVISVEIYSTTKTDALKIPIWTSVKPVQEFKFERK